MSPDEFPSLYSCEAWEIDLARRELRHGGAVLPLGSRAFDILAVLVRAEGQLVTYRSLTSAVWPGSIVEANTLQVHIFAIRKAFGADRSMLRTASGQGYRLLGPWVRASQAGVRDAAPSTNAPAVPLPTNLPVIADLVGRADAIQPVRDLMSAYRLVTITGDGGIGKTVLSLAVAHAELTRFRGDACLVELAALSPSDSVVACVATALALPMDKQEASFDSVIHGIADRLVMILVDNCEHMLDAVAELAEALVRSCPRVTILATSRERLRADGEAVYRLGPLPTPLPAEFEASTILASPAVQLFIEKLEASESPNWATPQTLRAVAEICRRLDGLPLAIEFAAARSDALGVETVLAEFNDHFSLLAEGPQTAVPRHRTLRTMLDWSYRLLSPMEQRLLQRLAIFPSSFVREAVFAVTADFTEPAAAIVDALTNLIEKCMLQVEPGQPGLWRLLQTTRAYARGEIANTQDAYDGNRLHAQFCRNLFDISNPVRTFPGLFARMDVYANAHTAIAWAFSTDGDIDLGTELATAYCAIWSDISLASRCRDRIETFLQTTDFERIPDPVAEMRLLFTLGLTLLHTYDPAERLEDVLQRAFNIATKLGDLDWKLRILLIMSEQRINKADHEAAERLGTLFLQTSRESGNLAHVAVADQVMGNALHHRGNQTEAYRYFERALEYYSSSGRRYDPNWLYRDQLLLTQARRARVLWLRGRIAEARRIAADCVEGAEFNHDKHELCLVLAEVVCPLALADGDLPAAGQAIAQLIETAIRHSMTYWVTFGRCHEAVYLIRTGDTDLGTKALRSALALFRENGRTVFYIGFVVDLAQALIQTGSEQEAFNLLGEAASRYDPGGTIWCAPEIRRLRGELLVLSSGHAAELFFQDALSLARDQGALFWEVRAALSLVRLKLRKGLHDEARAILLPVYQAVPETHRSADLKEATMLLAEIAQKD
jgi:predicted ATPase/DNA-binding winged helix-turn-helix (wHTH) protein